MYKARDLLNYTEDQMLGLPVKPFTLVFDDGEELKLDMYIDIITKGGDPAHVPYNPVNNTTLSWHYWLLHRDAPWYPLTSNHHIRDRIFTDSVHIDLLTNVYFDKLDAYRKHFKKEPSHPEREQWMRDLFMITNNIYNMFSDKLHEYVTGSSGLDFLEIHDHPKVQAINQKIKEREHVTPAFIDETQKEFIRVITNPQEFVGNSVADSATRELVSLGQILQCSTARGFVEDINNHIFPEPIKTGFFEGIYNRRDYERESRSSSKSYMAQNRDMSESEYQNRQQQLLVASPLQDVVYGDCGNTRTYGVRITNSNHLSNLAGIWYKDKPEDAEWKIITTDEQDLLGKTVHIRSLFGCSHPHPTGICSSCYGGLYDSWVYPTNIGWQAAAVIFGAMGQLLLSTKHEDGSVSANAIATDEVSAEFIEIGGADNCSIYLKPEIAKRKPTIHFGLRNNQTLSDVGYVEDVRTLSASRLTSYLTVEIALRDRLGHSVLNEITVGEPTREAYLTYEALAYIKEKGWRYNDNLDYVVDFSDWDYSKPFMGLPYKHHSVASMVSIVKTAIQSPHQAAVKRLVDFDNPDEATQHIYDIIVEKMPGLNYTNLQIVVAAYLARDPENLDFSLPKPIASGKFESYSRLMNTRSAGAMMAYQEQHKFLTDPEMYLIKNRVPSLLDQYLMHTLSVS